MHDDDCNEQSERIYPIITAEALRNASALHHHQPKTAKIGDERISLFWRIFGGTILSIVALVIITACQSVYSSIRDLQKDIARLNEGKAEFVRADEYSATRTKTWERFAEVQKDVASQSAPINQMKDRIGQLEEQCKALGADRKDAQELSATLKERLTQFEQQLNAIKMSQKDMLTVQQTLSALQEKTTLRDQQFTQFEEERKDMQKDLLALRERIARIEAIKEPQAPAKPTTPNTKSSSPEDGISADRH